MSNERTPHLQELIRLSTKAKLTVPTLLLEDVANSFEAYHDFRIALYCLKNDDGLIVTEKEVDDDLTEITIQLREDWYV